VALIGEAALRGDIRDGRRPEQQLLSLSNTISKQPFMGGMGCGGFELPGEVAERYLANISNILGCHVVCKVRR
jgi:hypothetical protein